MNSIKFIQVDPDTLTESILTGVRKELKSFAKEMIPKDPNEYLTRKEVSELLKVNISTVDNWTRKGNITPLYIGNRVYFKKSSLEECLIQL